MGARLTLCFCLNAWQLQCVNPIAPQAGSKHVFVGGIKRKNKRTKNVAVYLSAARYQLPRECGGSTRCRALPLKSGLESGKAS